MKPITPKGTRTRAISIPLGRRQDLHRLPHRIGERGHLAQAGRHLLDARVGEGEPVEEGAAGVAQRPDAVQVGAVGLEHGGRLLLEPAGHLGERLVLRLGGREREQARCDPGCLRLPLHMCAAASMGVPYSTTRLSR